MTTADGTFDSTLGFPGEGPGRARSQPIVGKDKRGPHAWDNFQQEAAEGDDRFEGLRIIAHAVQDDSLRKYLPEVKSFLIFARARRDI